MNAARSRLIVALDVPDRFAALASAKLLSGHVGWFKVGLELYVREGPRVVEEIVGMGEKVFLDLKLHDIPNTVAGAVRSACGLGVRMLTLHASGGGEMLRAARAAADSPAGSPPTLLAVTALTSISEAEARRIGIGPAVGDWVEQLADVALQSGIHGLVTSALEVSRLRRRFGAGPRLVIPGIRPSGTASQDQARTGRPFDAIRAGADFLVVGRPILQAAHPPAAADDIVAEIAEALESA